MNSRPCTRSLSLSPVMPSLRYSARIMQIVHLIITHHAHPYQCWRNWQVMLHSLPSFRQARASRARVSAWGAGFGLGDGLRPGGLVSPYAGAMSAEAPMRIFVDTVHGPLLELIVQVSDTVEVIKAAMHERDGRPWYQQRLLYADELLVLDRPLRTYGIQDGSTLTVAFAWIMIRMPRELRPLFGDEIVWYGPRTTVWRLKHQLALLIDVPAEEQVLIFGEEQLEDGRAVTDGLQHAGQAGVREPVPARVGPARDHCSARGRRPSSRADGLGHGRGSAGEDRRGARLSAVLLALLQRRAAGGRSEALVLRRRVGLYTSGGVDAQDTPEAVPLISGLRLHRREDSARWGAPCEVEGRHLVLRRRVGRSRPTLFECRSLGP